MTSCLKTPKVAITNEDNLKQVIKLCDTISHFFTHIVYKLICWDAIGKLLLRQINYKP
jgi:hypothetical protein